MVNGLHLRRSGLVPARPEGAVAGRRRRSGVRDAGRTGQLGDGASRLGRPAVEPRRSAGNQFRLQEAGAPPRQSHGQRRHAVDRCRPAHRLRPGRRRRPHLALPLQGSAFLRIFINQFNSTPIKDVNGSAWN